MLKKVVFLTLVVLLSLSFDSCSRGSGCPANQEKAMKKRPKKAKSSGILPTKANKKYGIRSR